MNILRIIDAARRLQTLSASDALDLKELAKRHAEAELNEAYDPDVHFEIACFPYRRCYDLKPGTH